MNQPGHRYSLTLKDLALGLMLVTVVVAVYGRMLSADFISFDDSVYVVDNPAINRGLTWDGLKDVFDFRQDSGPYWHPVTSLSHMADCALFGLNPGRHHGMNILFHALNALLLFAFLFRFTGKRWTSAWVAAIFALHPLNVESVAWVSERKNLLATMFFLLGLFAYARFYHRRTWGNYGLLVLVFLAGLMSKPTMMTFPFTLFLILIWPLGGYDMSGGTGAFFTKNRGLIFTIVPLIILMLTVFFIGVHLGEVGRNVAPLSHIPLKLRLSNMVIADLTYLVNMVFPFKLSVFHPYPATIPAAYAFGAVAVLTAVSVLAVALVRKQPFLFMGWFWYTGNLVTASGLMQQGYFPSHADRFTYLPLIGIFIILAWGIPRWTERLRLNPRILPTAGLLVLGFLSVLTVRQTAHWKNGITLFSHAVAVNPDDAMSLTNLALALGEAGQYDNAMEISYRALALEPDYAEALNNLGTVYAKKGDIEKSLEFFERALEAYPGFTLAKANRQNAIDLLNSRKKKDYAVKQALETPPDSFETASALAAVLMRENRFDDAETLYLGLLESHPQASVSITYNLACLNIRTGRMDTALHYLESSFIKGFTAWDYLDHDPDMNGLRDHPGFTDLLSRYRREEKKP